MTALTAAALLVPTAVVAVAPVASAAPADDAPPPNERAPRNPAPPNLGDTPWTSEAGQDMRGYRLSTYTGKNYDKRFEQFRLCVVQRESGGYYDVASPYGYQGAYQFGQSWAGPILDRIEAEMVATYGETVRTELRRLAKLSISDWPRFWQDAGFWAIFDKGAGAGNWAGGTWSCDPRPSAERGWPNPNQVHYSPLERNKPGRSSAPSAAASPATSPAAVSGTPESSQQLARDYIRSKYGWRYAEFRALKSMWWRESNWRYEVINHGGPYYGLGQVNGDYIASLGYSINQYMSSPLVQVKVGAAYIKARYGSPTLAWAFWRQHNWY
ncbi:MAG: hypothetical protein ACR2KE_05880 [Candidatus Nanopelagicales bacterium]